MVDTSPNVLCRINKIRANMYEYFAQATRFVCLCACVCLSVHTYICTPLNTKTHTPSSTVKDRDYRVVEIRILKSGRRYQPKLIIHIISQR